MPAPVREALYVYLDSIGNMPNAPATFVAQHLDQEWARPKGYADHGRASRAYDRRADAPSRDQDRVALSI
jgi:hypothetical protein